MPAPPPLAERPASAAALLARGEALLDLGRPADAAEVLERALALDPDCPETLGQLGIAVFRTGDHARALALADRHVAVAPHREWAHRQRGTALLPLGRPAEALAAADEAVRLDPDVAFAHQLRRDALRAIGGRADEARAAVARVLDLAPDRPDSHALAARDALADRRWTVAEAHARDALALDANHGDALTALARALRGRGRTADAADVALQVAQRDPERGHALLREMARAHTNWRRLTTWWYVGAAYYGAVHLGVVGPRGLWGHLLRVLVLGWMVRFAVRWLRARRFSPAVREALRADHALPGQLLPWLILLAPFFVIGAISVWRERRAERADQAGDGSVSGADGPDAAPAGQARAA